MENIPVCMSVCLSVEEGKVKGGGGKGKKGKRTAVYKGRGKV